MNFKTTIAAFAFSASAIALMPPPTQTKTICLSKYEDNDGVIYAGSCDEAKNNQILGLDILANGCAANQVSVTARKYQGGKFSVEVGNCMPPNVVQL